jgi:precorrin-6Y C5,15-methyltransferase (decarboxylating)
MYKAIVFAGTTEGYEICRFLSENGIGVYACVATGYGSRSLKEHTNLKVCAKRLDKEAMEVLFEEIRPEIILDATHPYAAQVTENIRHACENSGFPYQRVLREEGSHQKSAVYVESTEAAVEYLKQTEGNILLTTGSKELAKFVSLPDFGERLYARVLSLASVLETCKELGFEGKHLIGMQGPFSTELNAAMLRQYDCRYLVTKDTGKAGGFQEKIDAAMECGVIPVIIGRPLVEEGLSVVQCKQMLAEKFRILVKPQVTVLGIGMGSRDTLTIQGKKAIEEADLIIGAKRMADAIRLPGQAVEYEYRSEKIAEYIQNHPEYSNIVIALSGDVGFYSGAKKLLEQLPQDTKVICGVSSVVYFMAKTGMSWDDAKIVSAHGRDCNLVSLIAHHAKVFAILGTKEGVAELAGKLVYYGMGEVLLYVGENLSYNNEKIFAKTAAELTEYEGDALSVVCAYNENAKAMPTTHGISDEEFIRGKAPMTKEEVRTVSLSKLRLEETSVCYDVGAGTGSVSVEMALRAHQGKVYAIEKKDEAAELLKENKRKFAVDNLEIIKGEAPKAMEELPVPTHAFIGGSSGNLLQIVELLLQKNPSVRIVINCITLETVTEALFVMKKYGFTDTEVVQLSGARSKTIGRYHMMMGENPIYIITCQGGNVK